MTKYIPIYLSITVSVPSLPYWVETPTPSVPQSNVSPFPGYKGGTHSPAGEGFQFRQLEIKPSTLSTLWYSCMSRGTTQPFHCYLEFLYLILVWLLSGNYYTCTDDLYLSFILITVAQRECRAENRTWEQTLRQPPIIHALTVKKEKTIFLTSYISNPRRNQMQLTASSYMTIYLRVSSYFRKPFLICGFAPNHFWIFNMRKVLFLF